MNKKEQIINKRHLEKMEETKYKKHVFFPFLSIGNIERIPKRCKFECRKFNKCKLSKFYDCKSFEGWE